MSAKPKDDENHATVVLDLKKLKEEMAKKNDLSAAAVDLEFNVGVDEEPTNKVEAAPSFKVIMFEYGKPIFEQSKKIFPPGFNYVISKDVKELSGLLKSSDFQIVMFFYNGDPKAVNTLCSQVKAKFPNTKSVIVAQNLAPDKVKLHQSSPSGAHAYITLPFETEKIKQIFLDLHKSAKK